MAGSSRRLALAVILLPLLVMSMAGFSLAAVIHVNTLTSEPVPTPGPLCTLPDAIASSGGTLNNCIAGTGNDTIVFDLTGTIVVDEPLIVGAPITSLVIQGPLFGGIVLDGGGTSQILDHESGDLTLNNLTFRNGFADIPLVMQGGAILANSTGHLNINDSAFANNFASTGGAIFAGFGTITIINSTFANNRADLVTGSGGAIFNNAATVKIGNCTFYMNHAAPDLGGALGWAAGFPPTLQNTILVSVPGLEGGEDSDNCQAPGDVPQLVGDNGFNISDDETCFSGATSSLINTALKLDPDGLENNGGPTPTVEPGSTSPAIDFVPIASCVDFASNPLLNDQRLFFRPDLDAGVPETFCDAGAVETGALPPISIVPNSLRLQIATGSAPNTDKIATAFTFAINGAPDCADEDALNDGLELSLFHGMCATLPTNGLMLNLNPFVVHTVNHQSYGTLFQKEPAVMLQQATEQVNARMVALATPAGACGEWTLNLEVSGLSVSAPVLNLGGGNPYALVLTDIDGDRAGCFDISNAIVGTQLPTPRPGGGTRKVRRK